MEAQTSVAATPPPTAVNSGDTALTFDELEGIESSHKQAAKEAKKQQTQVANEAAKKAVEKTEKSKDQKESDEKEEIKEAKEDGKEAAKKSVDTKAPEKKEAKKLIKGKLADKDLDLDPDLVIPVTIDGKEETISVRDLMSQYSGKVSYDKKFSEFNKERQKFMGQHDQINSMIKRIVEEKDPELKFFHMAEFIGGDPVQIREKFLNDNMKLLEEWYAMSEDERKAANKDFENKVLRHRLESKQKDEAKRQSESDLKAKISELGKTHQITEDEFWDTFDKIEAAKKAGNFKEKITPEYVAEVATKERLWTAAAPIVEASKKFPEEKKVRFMIDLVNDAHKMGLSSEGIKKLAQQYASVDEEALEEKVKQQEEVRVGKKETKKPESKEKNEAMFFEDIV